MKRQLNWADLTQALHCVYELLGAADLEDFTDRMIGVMPNLVGCDVAAYNEVDPARGRFIGKLNPSDALDETMIAAFAAHATDNPLINHVQQNPHDIAVYKITDFVAQRQFRKTALCRDVYGRGAGEYQIAMPFPSFDGSAVALTFNRSRDFSPRDQRLLTMLQPLLVRAYRNAAALSDLRTDHLAVLDSIEQLKRGVAVVSREGKLLAANSAARESVEQFLPDSSIAAGGLPEPIARWLNSAEHYAGIPTGPAQALEVRQADRVLTVSAVAGGPRPWTLLLFQESAPKALSRLGLTPRECQVLQQIAAGAGNKQIATDLSVSQRTVEKHTENILRKLGVTSRTAACAVAMRAMAPLPEGQQ